MQILSYRYSLFLLFSPECGIMSVTNLTGFPKCSILSGHISTLPFAFPHSLQHNSPSSYFGQTPFSLDPLGIPVWWRNFLNASKEYMEVKFFLSPCSTKCFPFILALDWKFGWVWNLDSKPFSLRNLKAFLHDLLDSCIAFDNSNAILFLNSFLLKK